MTGNKIDRLLLTAAKVMWDPTSDETERALATITVDKICQMYDSIDVSYDRLVEKYEQLIDEFDLSKTSNHIEISNAVIKGLIYTSRHNDVFDDELERTITIRNYMVALMANVRISITTSGSAGNVRKRLDKLKQQD